jgi:hypothetical protein
MVKSFTRNSILANGRISTLSLPRSRRQRPENLSGTHERRKPGQELNFCQRRALAQTWIVSVDPSQFTPSCVPAFLSDSLFSRRVKGAWWPSRSSKSLSVPNDRGRFDSYPLRPKSLRKAGTQETGINRGWGRKTVFVRGRSSETPEDALPAEESKRTDSRSASSSSLLSCVLQTLGVPNSKGGDLDVA